MKKTKWLKIILLSIFVALAVYAGWRFPWKGTWAAIKKANIFLLSVACLINLSSLAAKGWSWHLLLKPLAYNHFEATQKATFIGAMINCISISFVGEAARVENISRREKIPLPPVLTSLVWERLIEGISLAVLIIIAPIFLNLPSGLKAVWVGAVGVVILFSLLTFGLFHSKPHQIYRFLSFINKSLPDYLNEFSSPALLLLPILLTLYSWTAEWLTFHLSLMSFMSQPALVASYLALLATNLGGALRLTPANVGVFQASMVVSVAACGIPSETAMAASLALQGLQVIPVILIGFLLVSPWKNRKKDDQSNIKPGN